MTKTRRFVTTLLLAFSMLAVMAIPAKRGVSKFVTLTDGSTVKVSLAGDEHLHFWVDSLGNRYVPDDAQGLYRLASDDDMAKSKARLRARTEATAQIAGFAKAVELRQEHYEEKLAHMAALKEYCRAKLLDMGGVVPVGSGTAPHILAVSLVGYPSGNIVTELGAQGICISAGSACHQGKASHVVSALGLDKKTAAGVIRISFSPDNTNEDVDALCAALKAHRDSRFPML